MALTYNELHRNIQDTFHAASVEIASPGLMALRQDNQPNIPDEYLPKDYNPPKNLFSFISPSKKSE
jgi:small-conductance mechanosensitive channel